MKIISYILVLLGFLISTVSWQLSDFEDIFKHHIAATGHAHKNDVGMIRQEGVYSLGKVEIKFKSYHSKGKLRIEYFYNKKKPAVSVYTPDSSWKTSPWNLKGRMPLSDVELMKMREWAQLTGVLANYKELGFTEQFSETDNTNNDKIIVKLLAADQITKVYVSLNSKTFLTESMELVEWKGGGEKKTLTTYKAYDDIEGLMVPKVIEESVNPTIKISYRVQEIDYGLKHKSKLFE